MICRLELQLLETFPAEYTFARRETPFGLIVTVELSRRLYEEAARQLGDVVFEVHLEGKFPFAPPVLCCVTHFTRPTIADGRDLLQHVIRSTWSPSYTISSLVSELPGLVRSCATQGPRCALEMGTYPLEAPLSLSTWEGLDSMSLFPCKELDSDESRLLVITETALLLLTQPPKYLNIGLPTFFLPLLSLSDIRRQRKSPTKLTFEWSVTGQTQSLALLVKESDRCLTLISNNVSALKRIPTVDSGSLLNEEDVTKKALRKIPINEVLQAIAVYESNFDDQLNVEMVNSLLGLYQQAIEYFSGVGDPRYDEFLDRMHVILSKDEVLAVLGGETKPKVQKQKTEVRREPREVLSKEIADDLVLETPLIETLPTPPSSSESPAP